MNVLHVFKTYLPDNFAGIERVIWEIAEGCYPLGVRSEVLSVSPHPVPDLVPVGHHLSRRARRDLDLASTGLSLSLFRVFRERAWAADLVHYHFPWPMMDLLHLLTPPGKPTVVTYHSDVVRQRTLLKLYAPVMHRFFQRVDRIVATSPNYLRSSLVLQQYAGKTEVIPIGIGEVPPVDAALRQHWQDRLPERFFLFVGALRYYKGLPTLIEAAQVTGYPVVVIGRGEMEREIRQTAPAGVTLLGALPDTDKLAVLALCAGFVFPSHLRSEAFGVALLEAARSGKPMISCEIGTGTSFVNADGVTGRIVPPEDALALAGAMREIWSHPERAAAMGRAARERYETLFTAERMAGAYAELYGALVAS